MSEPRIRRRTSCLLDLVGNTPLVPITRLNPNPNVEIWAKIESMNPGGSVKDRIAKSMIEAAEASGELTRDKIILEPTSGNTGIGLAMVAAVKGYRILLAMSEGVSVERRRILSAFGAEILLKATKVNGVYDSDPATHKDAAFIKETHYMEVLEKNLQIMDMSAISLAMDNNLPILVFNLTQKGNVKRVVCGEDIGTLIKRSADRPR